MKKISNLSSRSLNRRTVVKSVGGLSIAGTVTNGNTQSIPQNRAIDVDAAVQDHTIYTGDEVGVLHAFQPDGGERWTFKIDDEHEGGSYLRIKSGPTCVDGIIYFGTGIFSIDSVSTVYAVDATKGNEQWRFEEATGPLASCPTVVDGAVYIGSDDNNLYAIDAESGDEIWTYETDNWVRSSPTATNGLVYVGGRDGYVHAVDSKTGDRIWRTEIGEGTDSSPTVYKSRLFIGSNQGTIYSLDATTGDKLWTVETDDSISASPTCFNDCVFIGSDDQTLYALNTTDGSTRWQLDMDDEVNTPTIYENTLYVGTDAGYVYAVAVEDGDVIWKGPINVEISGNVAASVATVIYDRIYILHGRALMCLDRETGKARWNKALDGLAGGSPPTVVAGIGEGNSIGSRVRSGTLGHTDYWASRADSDVTLRLNNVGSSAWEGTTIVGDAIPLDTDAENPKITLQSGTRYFIENDGWPTHPLEFRDGSGGVLLSQDATGQLEADSAIAWTDTGDTLAFTLTEELGQQLSTYACTVHASMQGTITRSSAGGGEAPSDPQERALQIAGKNSAEEVTQNDVTTAITRFNRGETANDVAVEQDDVTTLITLFERN